DADDRANDRGTYEIKSFLNHDPHGFGQPEATWFGDHVEVAAGRCDEVDQHRDTKKADQCRNDVYASDQCLRAEGEPHVGRHFRYAYARYENTEGASREALQQA